VNQDLSPNTTLPLILKVPLLHPQGTRNASIAHEIPKSAMRLPDIRDLGMKTTTPTVGTTDNVATRMGADRAAIHMTDMIDHVVIRTMIGHAVILMMTGHAVMTGRVVIPTMTGRQGAQRTATDIKIDTTTLTASGVARETGRGERKKRRRSGRRRLRIYPRIYSWNTQFLPSRLREESISQSSLALLFPNIKSEWLRIR
jgi:hypothetical protein